MKALFFSLSLVSVSAFAQRIPGPQVPVMPRVLNYGHSAEIQAWNDNRMGVYCSGRVTLRLASGGRPSVPVSFYVPGMGFRSQRIGLTDPRDRIQFVNHSIWCN